MNRMARVRTLWLAIGLVLLSLTIPLGLASAQQFPPSQIKIVVPFPAGGTTDILARFIAQYLGDRLGVSTIVENRAGASGTIGSEMVAKAPADGSVLLIAATHHVINPSLFRQLPYDTQVAFSPVAVVASAPNALVVTKDFPAKNVAELIRAGEEGPGQAFVRLLRNRGRQSSVRRTFQTNGGRRHRPHPLQGSRARDERSAWRPYPDHVRHASGRLGRQHSRPRRHQHDARGVASR